MIHFIDLWVFATFNFFLFLAGALHILMNLEDLEELKSWRDFRLGLGTLMVLVACGIWAVALALAALE